MGRRVLDCSLDVDGTHVVELLGDVLLGLQPCPVERLLEGARADDQEGGLAVVDELAELLDIRTGKSAPEVAAHTADGSANERAADDRRREEDADDGARSAPPQPPCRVAISSLLTCTFPDESLDTTAAS